jgi:hypothetical protein
LPEQFDNLGLGEHCRNLCSWLQETILMFQHYKLHCGCAPILRLLRLHLGLELNLLVMLLRGEHPDCDKDRNGHTEISKNLSPVDPQ